jgi:hypothetical protein
MKGIRLLLAFGHPLQRGEPQVMAFGEVAVTVDMGVYKPGNDGPVRRLDPARIDGAAAPHDDMAWKPSWSSTSAGASMSSAEVPVGGRQPKDIKPRPWLSCGAQPENHHSTY